jgi:hypothetical protein
VGGVKCNITISIGLAWLDCPGRSWDEWLNLADAACYQAKQQGRNRGANMRCQRKASGYESLSREVIFLWQGGQAAAAEVAHSSPVRLSQPGGWLPLR